MVGFFVAFGGVLYGYGEPRKTSKQCTGMRNQLLTRLEDTGTISGILAMPFWLKTFSTGYMEKGMPAITGSQQSEIVSLLSAGTFFGALTAGPTGEFFGRRLGLMVSVLVFTFGVILQVAATEIPLFIAGRFFAGYGVGMISALIPLYQSETAPKWIRGTIVGAYQLAITIGLLLASVVDNATHTLNNSGSYRYASTSLVIQRLFLRAKAPLRLRHRLWNRDVFPMLRRLLLTLLRTGRRIPIAVQFAWGLILFFGMLLLPETPRM